MSAIQIELPRPVHLRAQKLARAQSMSLDRLMVVALVEKLSTVFPDANLEKRARPGERVTSWPGSFSAACRVRLARHREHRP